MVGINLKYLKEKKVDLNYSMILLGLKYSWLPIYTVKDFLIEKMNSEEDIYYDLELFELLNSKQNLIKKIDEIYNYSDNDKKIFWYVILSFYKDISKNNNELFDLVSQFVHSHIEKPMYDIIPILYSGENIERNVFIGNQKMIVVNDFSLNIKILITLIEQDILDLLK
jgi:hypothetical protein